MKSIHYLATVVKTYREALDSYILNPATYQTKPEWIQELRKLSHRGYCTGFYLNDPSQTIANFEDSHPDIRHRFAGIILGRKDTHRFEIDVRNKIFRQTAIEILGKRGPATPDMIIAILDENGNPLPHAQPNTTVDIIVRGEYATNDIVRICNEP
jgi:putative protease